MIRAEVLKLGPRPFSLPFRHDSRSLRLPFFSLALALLWFERPSLFLLLSPLKAPPASLMRPLALSIAASFLSSLLLVPGTVCPLSFPQLTFPTYYTLGRG